MGRRQFKPECPRCGGIVYLTMPGKAGPYVAQCQNCDHVWENLIAQTMLGRTELLASDGEYTYSFGLVPRCERIADNTEGSNGNG